jgi:hypothetical protein
MTYLLLIVFVVGIARYYVEVLLILHTEHVSTDQ